MEPLDVILSVYLAVISGFLCVVPVLHLMHPVHLFHPVDDLPRPE